MSTHETNSPPAPRQDKQLRGIALDAVLEKRRLDQALNAKEFAVCAGVSYSTARHWFHLPGFPAVHGVVFWPDFVQWRATQNRSSAPALLQEKSEAFPPPPHLPPRAARILLDT